MNDWLKEIEEPDMIIFVRIEQLHVLKAPQVDILTSEIKLLASKQNYTNKLRFRPCCSMVYVK